MTNTQFQPDLNHSVRTAMFLVIFAYILIYLLPLGIRPLSAPDETRYGQIPHEMITTGHWADPHLVGLRYFEKPPMGYWLNAISLKLFGENNFAIRFPTALSVGLSAWFVWLLLIRMGYSRSIALTSAAIYMSMTEVLLVGTIAVLDSPFTLFLNAGMILFYLGVNDNESRRTRSYLIASGISFGLAFMTKGFLALVLPGMILFVYALLQKRYKLLWTSTIVAFIGVVVVIPWGIIIHLREPDFWRYFVVVEHIQRFMEPNAQHPEPFYFFIMLFPVMAFPWLAYLPAAFKGIRNSALNRDLFRYLALWFVLPFLFFSVSRGKLTTYLLPVFAPFTVLMAIGVSNYLNANRTRLFKVGAMINLVTMLILMAFVIYDQYFGGKEALFSSGETMGFYLLLLSILLSAIVSVLPIYITSPYPRLFVVAVTIVPIYIFITFVLPHTSLARLTPITLIKKEMHRIKSNTILVTDGSVVRAVAWEFKRTDIYLTTKGELGYGLSYPDAKNRFIGTSGLDKLLQEQENGTVTQDIAYFCQETCPVDKDIMKKYDAKRYSDNNFTLWLIQSKHSHK